MTSVTETPPVRPRSELEDFLQNLHARGQLDSTGEFTLSREKALDKLAAFLLPRPTAWASKVVQAVVLSGAPALAIKQTSLGTEFHFTPREDSELTLDALEAAFFNPETAVRPALDHLRQALWSVSLNGMRPFHYARNTQALVWTGSAFQHTTCRPVQGLRLTVSHRTVWEGQGLPGLRTLEAARINADTAQELAERAFVCPLPLTLDGRRLDRLQAQPGVPLGLVYTDAPDLPALGFPKGTLTTTKPRPGALNPLLLLSEEPGRLAAACLIATHAEKVQHEGQNVFRGVTRQHVFHWVRHGVVVDTHFINQLEANSVTAAVIASAEGLRSDLAGFSVAKDEVTGQRQAAVYRALRPHVKDVPFTLQTTGNAALRGVIILGSGLLYSAGTVMSAGILPTLVAAGAAALGIYATRHHDADQEFVDSQRAAFELLQRAWPSTRLP